MDLISITITGWRRFAKTTKVETNGKLVSILGPNEAGKSSLLQAIRFLRSADDVDFKDISRDANREDLKIVGYFYLEKDELEEAGLTQPTRLILTKSSSGPATFRLEPSAPKRDLNPRREASSVVERAISQKKFREIVEQNDEFTEELQGIQAILKSDAESLSETELADLDEIMEHFETLDLGAFPKYIQSIPQLLSELNDFERLDPPSKIASTYVAKQIPDILMFGADERDLHQEYDLEALASDVPLALENFASVANLDIAGLIAVAARNDAAAIETIKARANRTLRERFAEVWSQSGVHASISLKGTTLNILIENDRDEFTALAERSDGFRQFVALQTFTMKSRSKRPILLIDEAEIHLHYDAQADLVQMLSKQQVASKIIYTTHSAGCLPEDLGNGVRLVSQVPGTTSQSRVVNRFWGEKEAGFSPLLIGMGASTLAFFPTRRALLVEGETEMLLLPTMLREALASASLGYQVIPGLSRADKSQLLGTKEGTRHVAYLVDGDDGGKAIRKELIRVGIPPKSIFSLAAPGVPGCEVEDFISIDVLHQAVNSLIGKFSPGAPQIDKKQVGSWKRISSFGLKYKAATSKELNKIEVAYEILSAINENPELQILDQGRAKIISKLSEDIFHHFFSA